MAEFKTIEKIINKLRIKSMITKNFIYKIIYFNDNELTLIDCFFIRQQKDLVLLYNSKDS